MLHLRGILTGPRGLHSFEEHGSRQQRCFRRRSPNPERAGTSRLSTQLDLLTRQAFMRSVYFQACEREKAQMILTCRVSLWSRPSPTGPRGHRLGHTSLSAEGVTPPYRRYLSVHVAARATEYGRHLQSEEFRALSMPVWLVFCSAALMTLDFIIAVMPRRTQNSATCFAHYLVLSSFSIMICVR